MFIGIFRNGTYTLPYSSIEQMTAANRHRIGKLMGVLFGETEEEAEQKATEALQKLMQRLMVAN